MNVEVKRDLSVNEQPIPECMKTIATYSLGKLHSQRKRTLSTLHDSIFIIRHSILISRPPDFPNQSDSRELHPAKAQFTTFLT